MFDATCPDGCTRRHRIEARPTDRKLLGEGRFDLAAGEPGTDPRFRDTGSASSGSQAATSASSLRSDGVNSGFNTFIEQ